MYQTWPFWCGIVAFYDAGHLNLREAVVWHFVFVCALESNRVSHGLLSFSRRAKNPIEGSHVCDVFIEARNWSAFVRSKCEGSVVFALRYNASIGMILQKKTCR
jgi:hypothetical protein